MSPSLSATSGSSGALPERGRRSRRGRGAHRGCRRSRRRRARHHAREGRRACPSGSPPAGPRGRARRATAGRRRGRPRSPQAAARRTARTRAAPGGRASRRARASRPRSRSSSSAPPGSPPRERRRAVPSRRASGEEAATVESLDDAFDPAEAGRHATGEHDLGDAAGLEGGDPPAGLRPIHPSQGSGRRVTSSSAGAARRARLRRSTQVSSPEATRTRGVSNRSAWSEALEHVQVSRSTWSRIIGQLRPRGAASPRTASCEPRSVTIAVTGWPGVTSKAGSGGSGP